MGVINRAKAIWGTEHVGSVPERPPIFLLITPTRRERRSVLEHLGQQDRIMVVIMKGGEMVAGKEKEKRGRTGRNIYAGKGEERKNREKHLCRKRR